MGAVTVLWHFMVTTEEGYIKLELELEKGVCFMWATADFYYIPISSPTLSALVNNKTNGPVSLVQGEKRLFLIAH